MSKGWDSKNVEEQQAAATEPKVANVGDKDPEARRAEAERKRKLQALEMQRERCLSEKTASPHRRSALELAIAQIEYELEQLGWSIKL